MGRNTLSYIFLEFPNTMNKMEERRELVRSELRMSTRPTSHHGRNEHRRAIQSAKCPKDSKMGECLINGQTKSSSVLDPRVGKITNEQRRTESRLQQHKKNFLRTSKCLNHEPLILVERPATPKVKSRASFMKKHGIDPAVVEMPRYMRPTMSRSRTPSTLTTIEAFTVDVRKKKNLWEKAVEDKDDVKFKSTYRSSARLTNAEVKMLKIGHSYHKPTEESILLAGETRLSDLELEDVDDEEDKTSSQPPRCLSGNKSKKKSAASVSAPTPSTTEPILRRRPETVMDGSVFVTQLSSNRESGINRMMSNNSNRLKSVTFSDFGKTEKQLHRTESAKDMLNAHKKGRAIVRQEGKLDTTQVVKEAKATNVKKNNNPPPQKPAPLKKSKSKPFLSLVLKN